MTFVTRSKLRRPSAVLVPRALGDDRENIREEIGQRLEAEVAEIRLAWLKQQTEREMRELLEQLGVSAEWKREMVTKYIVQGATGALDPRVAGDQITFIQSLAVNQ